jgi:DNA-binding NarL/FixJ family response regulator
VAHSAELPNWSAGAHLNQVYRKLDAHTRTQAGARAGQLRLLTAP